MGARLRERRTELGLSLSEVARRSSVSPSYLTAVESGGSTPSLGVLSRVAHALDLTIGDFLAGETTSTVRLGSLTDEPGTTTVSSDALQLQVAFQHAEPGDSGTCPFDVADSSVVVYVRAGSVEITIDEQEWRLEEGDSLHALEPDGVRWRSTEVPTTLVWAVAPTSVA